jgi:hypothetical protein
MPNIYYDYPFEAQNSVPTADNMLHFYKKYQTATTAWGNKCCFLWESCETNTLYRQNEDFC